MKYLESLCITVANGSGFFCVIVYKQLHHLKDEFSIVVVLVDLRRVDVVVEARRVVIDVADVDAQPLDRRQWFRAAVGALHAQLVAVPPLAVQRRRRHDVVLGAERPAQPEVRRAVADDRAVEATAGAAVRVANDHVTHERARRRVFRYAGDVGVGGGERVHDRRRRVVIHVVHLTHVQTAWAKKLHTCYVVAQR